MCVFITMLVVLQQLKVMAEKAGHGGYVYNPIIYSFPMTSEVEYVTRIQKERFFVSLNS